MIRFHHVKLKAFWVIIALLITSSYTVTAEGKGRALDLIPDVLIDIQAEKGVKYAIVVEKATQQLTLYAIDGSYREKFRFDCSTGEKSGPKALSGDKKTPEGVYFFIKEHKDKDLTPRYGTGAFPMDYPNILDRLEGKNGNAIWLHGLGRPLKPMDTQGCVALENDNLDKLKNYISLNRTPIIIEEKLSYVSVGSKKDIRDKINVFISKWNEALVKGTYHNYLEYYNSGYIPEISWWPEWDKLKRNLNDYNMDLKTKEVSIYKHKDVYVVLFQHLIKSGDREIDIGKRKMFLTDKDKGFKIIAEEFLTSPEKNEKYDPLIAAYKKMESFSISKRDIAKLVNDWLLAWSSKNIKNYENCYSKNFRSKDGMNLKQWLSYKRRLNRLYDYIKVSIEDLDISTGSKECTAVFVQHYESSGFRSLSDKKLIFRQENGKWKIFREISMDKKKSEFK